MIWAAVPLKPLDQAKGRLAPTLAPDQRRALVLAMLEDVLTTLLVAPEVYRVLLVSSDPTGQALARRLGATILHDEAGNLNGALAHAAVHAGSRGASALLVVPGDVPLLRTSDLAALTAPAPSPSLTIAPSPDGGTSALCVRPPLALPFLFGQASFARHSEAARRGGVYLRIYRAPAAALDDIDTPADLARLAHHTPHGATARVVAALGYEQSAANGILFAEGCHQDGGT